jgi:hypothetical protein
LNESTRTPKQGGVHLEDPESASLNIGTVYILEGFLQSGFAVWARNRRKARRAHGYLSID